MAISREETSTRKKSQAGEVIAKSLITKKNVTTWKTITLTSKDGTTMALDEEAVCSVRESEVASIRTDSKVVSAMAPIASTLQLMDEAEAPANTTVKAGRMIRKTKRTSINPTLVTDLSRVVLVVVEVEVKDLSSSLNRLKNLTATT